MFDVQGQRLQGTEAEGNLNNLRRENSNDLGMTITNWKSQHDQVSEKERARVGATVAFERTCEVDGREEENV